MAETRMAKAYPLIWPKGRERTKNRVQSRFSDKTIATALRPLKDELDRLRAQYIVISTNIPLKSNGDPYSDPGRMPDPGVAVYFRLKDKPYVLSCDRWLGVEENMYAIAKHIEALRGMERWGVASLEQTFAGFKELPSNASEGEDPWAVLELEPMSSEEAINKSHRRLALLSHPDRGGSQERMSRINTARDAALAAIRAEAA